MEHYHNTWFKALRGGKRLGCSSSAGQPPRLFLPNSVMIRKRKDDRLVVQSTRSQERKQSLGTRVQRVPELDIARTIALAAMAVFHFTWDLMMFGFLPVDTMQQAGWRAFAYAIAGSFLFLSGISVVLAHGDGIRWRSFLYRLYMLVLAAAAISLTTRLAIPDAWIRFGILHSIATSTVIALLFLRVPVSVLTLSIIVVFALGQVSLKAFDGPLWLWTGLDATHPRMMDYEPVFPWLGACLSGVLCTRLLRGRLALGLDGTTKAVRVLSWPGQHSLAIYLIHQPVLFGAVYVASQFWT